MSEARSITLVGCQSGFHARVGYLLALQADEIGEVKDYHDVCITVERTGPNTASVHFKYPERKKRGKAKSKRKRT